MEEANINAELLNERHRKRSIHCKSSNRGHQGPSADHDVETHEVVGTKTKHVMFWKSVTITKTHFIYMHEFDGA